MKDVFNESNIVFLLKYTNEEYRQYDPGQYLYRMLMKFPIEDRFSDDFIELVYTTLISWNMNQRGAKLSEFEVFRESIIKHQNQLKELFEVKMDNIDNVDNVHQKTKVLFENLVLVAESKPKLVTFSKAMHFINPQLFMPIDRRYTLNYFYKNTYVSPSEENQFEMYWDIFEEFRNFAIENRSLSKYQNNLWNGSVPKIIDNLIIAHVKLEENKLIQA